VDVLVIGGGVVGVSTALALSRHDVSVALVESGRLSPPRGSSAGAARMYAPAAFPDETYLRMGLQALHRWRSIEELSGRRLLHPTGVLSCGRFAGEQMKALRRAGVTVEELGARETLERFGVRIREGVPIIFQPDAGVLDARSAHAALLELARRSGVRTLEHETVEAVADRGEHVEVQTSATAFSCAATVVAAGPWSDRLLTDIGIDSELTPTSQTVVHFEVGDDGHEPPRALIDYEGDEPYALSEPGGGLKVAFHARGPLANPRSPLPSPDRDAAGRLRKWAADSYPALDLETGRSETCLYTNTRDERFRLERHGRIVTASACNGQGFQFAPESGAVAAGHALDAMGVTDGVVARR
jgi:glycine/D-amino acid oxidase-like deaminating enzyme